MQHLDKIRLPLSRLSPGDGKGPSGRGSSARSAIRAAPPAQKDRAACLGSLLSCQEGFLRSCRGSRSQHQCGCSQARLNAGAYLSESAGQLCSRSEASFALETSPYRPVFVTLTEISELSQIGGDTVQSGRRKGPKRAVLEKAPVVLARSAREAGGSPSPAVAAVLSTGGKVPVSEEPPQRRARKRGPASARGGRPAPRKPRSAGRGGGGPPPLRHGGGSLGGKLS